MHREKALRHSGSSTGNTYRQGCLLDMCHLSASSYQATSVLRPRGAHHVTAGVSARLAQSKEKHT